MMLIGLARKLGGRTPAELRAAVSPGELVEQIAFELIMAERADDAARAARARARR